ncbi:MAG: site-2 protease family protein [Clostridia bacterium]|nr:site-2 protease family protein [Clostridia bacterium]
MILELIMGGSSASFGETLAVIIITLVIALLSITFREYVKDRVAVKLGGNAAPSLNPAKHLNISDLFSVALTVLFSASWIKAKNPGLSRERTVAAALSAPIANLALAFVSVFIYSILDRINVAITTQTENQSVVIIWIAMIFQTCVLVNIAYAVFDFIPIPGTNGGLIIAQLLPEKAAEKFLYFDKFSFVVLLFLVIVFARSGVTATVVNAVATAMQTPFVALFNLIFPIG